MKKILVVDDEPAVLFALSEALTDKRRGWQVVTASDGKEAMRALQTEKIHFVVTDLRMPEVDGFELLAHLRRNHPSLPVILMTALGTAEISARLGADALECLGKPFDVEVLRQKIRDMLAQRVKGRVENISLSSFLQLLEIERKTCTLSVAAGGRQGQLYFRQGKLVGAETGDVDGQDAALEIVAWEHADIEISDGIPPGGPTIDTTLRFLLMEGMRLKDEREGGVAPPEVDLEPDEVLQSLAQPAPAPSRAAPDLAARVGDSLKKAKSIKGSAALLLAEIASGSVIGAVGDSAGVDLGIATAVAMAQLLRQKQRVTDQLGLHDPVQEILLTSADRYYVARSLGLGDGYFLLLILDRDKANLARAQLDLVAIERDLVERVSS